MLEVKNLSYRRGLANIEGAQFILPLTSHIGILGPNGVGKSTLLALLQGQIEILSGELRLPKEWRWNEVEQQLPDSQLSALEYVKQGHRAFATLDAAMLEAERSQQHERLAQLHHEMALIDGYTIESQAATLLNGLGFSTEMQLSPVNDFSGGWRMRLNLARALLNPADGLLLDEPTNHLDLEALIWLEKWLKNYQGLVLIVAHDSAFLDQVADNILNFEQGTIIHYRGNYSSFIKQRAEKSLQLQRAYEKQMQKRAHLQSFIDRFRAKASKAKQAQSRVKQLNKLQDIALIQDESSANFDFYPLTSTPSPLIRYKKTQIGYSNTPILSDVNFYLGLNERIGLLGRNGAGKSTLVKCLASVIHPLSGDTFTHDALKIGYFSQNELESLKPELSAEQQLAILDPKTTLQQRRDYLSKFGLISELALNPIHQLSGGQRARICLALLIWQKPNLLLLDEPTNHLDLNFRESLTIALQSFEGTLVVVSHDRDFLTQTVDEFYLVDDGKVVRFDGDLNDYAKWLTQTKPTNNKNIKTKSQPDQNQRQTHAERKQLANRVQQLEIKVNKLTQKLKELELLFANPKLYEENQSQDFQKLSQEKIHYQSQLQKVENEWFEALSQLESE